MKKITLYSILLLLIVINPVLSCSCIPPMTPQEELNRSTAVFLGEVIDIYRPKYFISSAEESVEITFNVSQTWKGPNYKTLTVKTAHYSASCGYNFEENKEYVVYASGEKDDLRVNLCSRTNLLENSQDDLNALGEANLPIIKQEIPFLKSIWVKIISSILKMF